MADWPSVPGCAVAEAGPCRVLLLRGAPDGALALLGMPEPPEPCTAAEAAGARLVWLSPDCYQIETADEALADAAIARLGAVEVTDARLVLELRGPRARDLLAVGTSVDLHECAFPPGSAVRTRFGRVTALIHLAGPGPVFRLHLDRPLERWFRTWLEGALRGLDA